LRQINFIEGVIKREFEIVVNWKEVKQIQMKEGGMF